MKLIFKLILVSLAIVCVSSCVRYDDTEVVYDAKAGIKKQSKTAAAPAPMKLIDPEPVEEFVDTDSSADETPETSPEYTPQEEGTSGSAVATSGEFPRKTGNPYVIRGVTYYPLPDVEPGYQETGLASWYGYGFHNRKTANGETYNMNDFTAAHKTLPMPTFVRVENLENGKTTVVRINDRGPFAKGRIIDLSHAAAQEIDMLGKGVAKVRLTVLSESDNHVRTEGKDVDIQAGNFAIQIGAFSNVTTAKGLATRYPNTVVVSANIDGKTLFRVQVKGYTSRNEAEAAAVEISREFPGAFVLAE